MRKSYLMMAAAATMLAACTQTDFVNEISTETPKAIEFEGGFVNKATRSENSNTSYNETFSDHHNTFAVWAYKKATPTSDRTVVFVLGIFFEKKIKINIEIKKHINYDKNLHFGRQNMYYKKYYKLVVLI